MQVMTFEVLLATNLSSRRRPGSSVFRCAPVSWFNYVHQRQQKLEPSLSPQSHPPTEDALMTTATPSRTSKTTNNESIFVWEGKDKSGRIVQGELRAASSASASASLRRQGVTTTRIKKKKLTRTKKIGEKDICFFTRQLATMIKAGVPLLRPLTLSRGDTQMLRCHACCSIYAPTSKPAPVSRRHFVVIRSILMRCSAIS